MCSINVFVLETQTVSNKTSQARQIVLDQHSYSPVQVK